MLLLALLTLWLGSSLLITWHAFACGYGTRGLLVVLSVVLLLLWLVPGR